MIQVNTHIVLVDWNTRIFGDGIRVDVDHGWLAKGSERRAKNQILCHLDTPWVRIIAIIDICSSLGENSPRCHRGHGAGNVFLDM